MKAKQHTLIVLLVFVLAAGAALALLTHANQKAEQAASEAEDGSIPLLDRDHRYAGKRLHPVWRRYADAPARLMTAGR